jgi:hypothetical protein
MMTPAVSSGDGDRGSGRLSGSRARASTALACPTSVCSRSNVRAFQMMIDLSADAETRSWSVEFDVAGTTRSALRKSVWPLSTVFVVGAVGVVVMGQA